MISLKINHYSEKQNLRYLCPLEKWGPQNLHVIQIHNFQKYHETNEAKGIYGCFSIYYQTNHLLENGDLDVTGNSKQYFDILNGTTEAKGLCGFFPSISNKSPILENIDYKGP